MMPKEMTNTVFGEVLAEMLEAQDMPASIGYVRGLADSDDVAGEKLLHRIEDPCAPHPGDATMVWLADRLELSRRERT